MASLKLMFKVACASAVLWAAVVSPIAQATMPTCNQMKVQLLPCSGLISGAAPTQACCTVLQSLEKAATGTKDRQDICNCFMPLAKNMTPDQLKNIPATCRLSNAENFKPNVNCANVK